jgi:hypothetical protein
VRGFQVKEQMGFRLIIEQPAQTTNWTLVDISIAKKIHH